MPRKTLIHIGYHKTASTWLQTKFFNNPGLQFNVPFTNKEFKKEVIIPHTFLFDEDIARNRIKAKTSNVANDETLVITAESISGSFLSDGADGIERANRIKKIFPDAVILINIREQRSILRSSYKHYLKGGGILTVLEWLNASKENTRGKLTLFDPIRFQYHHLISYYQSLFGAQNVLVLPCEQLWHSPKQYVQTIADFAHTELPENVRDSLQYQYQSNKGLSAYTANQKRHFNRFFMYNAALNPKPICRLNINAGAVKKLAHRIDRRLPEGMKSRSEKKLSYTIEQWAGHKFQESNRITSRLIDVNLKDYGYDI